VELGGPVILDESVHPPVVRAQEREFLDAFTTYLREHGVGRFSIPMPDRELGGWIMYLYEDVDSHLISDWSSGTNG